MFKIIATFIIYVLASFFAETAFAQSGGSDPDFEGNAGGIIVNGLIVSKVQDLDFGVIAPSLTVKDTVKTNRGANFDSVCGAQLTCFEPGNRARFKVIGEPNRFVTISDPGSIFIYNANGDKMLVDGFIGAGSANNSSWRGWQKLRPSGISRFNVGAILHVNPKQPIGNYIGTFVMNFDYQ